MIESLDLRQLTNKDEYDFWQQLLEEKSSNLKPAQFQLKPADLEKKLKRLRNKVLVIFLVVNLLWIIILYSLSFPVLRQYNLPERACSIAFLGVYGVLIIIQFFTMIGHRTVTLIHYLGRTEIETENIIDTQNIVQHSEV